MRIATVLLALALTGCVTPPDRPAKVDPSIARDLEAGQSRPAKPPAAVSEALLPPLRLEMPAGTAAAREPRFDLSVTNAPASQVFNAVVSGTRYSMLVHPEVTGTLSLNLKDVSIREAMDSIRELYGYDYKIEGSRIFVHPAGIQSRVFRVNYLTALRRGASDLRVQSGSVADSGGGTPPPLQSTPTSPAPGGPTVPGLQPTRPNESSRVTTHVVADFWRELRDALVGIIGVGEGRGVVVTPQSGVVVVRALPRELRAVERYLAETRLSVERQVMLEAKILEVTLSDDYQAGINWQLFRNSGPNIAVGQLGSATQNSTQLGARGNIIANSGFAADTTGRRVATAAAALPGGAVFGLAMQTSNFAALLQFLEAQGSVQVLSSPRIATLNNQKAVLKVGTDEFFVTNVSTVSTTTAAGTQQTPTVTVAPFFSGIVLDVTPQIDENGVITLHIHPSVSEVSESQRVVNLGGSVPAITLPLARSTVSETDTVVRVVDGNIVAIGGLMSVDVRDTRGGIPGVGDSVALLRNTDRRSRKRELVILLKPTLVPTDTGEQDLRNTRDRLDRMFEQGALESPRR